MGIGRIDATDQRFEVVPPPLRGLEPWILQGVTGSGYEMLFGQAVRNENAESTE